MTAMRISNQVLMTGSVGMTLAGALMTSPTRRDDQRIHRDDGITSADQRIHIQFRNRLPVIRSERDNAADHVGQPVAIHPGRPRNPSSNRAPFSCASSA